MTHSDLGIACRYHALGILGLSRTSTPEEIRAQALHLWSGYRAAYPTERAFVSAILDVEEDLAETDDLLGGFARHDIVNALSDIFAAAITAEEREAVR